MTMKEKTQNLELSRSALPIELLELIISCLPLEHNVRASVVCKRWHSVAISVWTVNGSPWLLYFYYGNLFIFNDPLQCKTHASILPKLNGCRANLELLSNRRLGLLSYVRVSEVETTLQELYKLWTKENESSQILVELKKCLGT
ncbi:hypothetical protein FH972_013583 [Carpinus fangiana]|uniref:F-box domain-containing protein n=1 Tax=Carpinus fangiana TaxID=176857 RepID=A0A5N6RAM4_9ROSI|nr:hypothetical protein FH972_013583 [Carpinus fangiana]